jgi:predicted tellurium resistance membrane protein TerC
MADIFSPEILISLATLTALEIVLGIDNVIFISIVAGRLEPARRKIARRWGLAGALVMRVLFLLSVVWIITLVHPLFTAFGFEFSWRDVILIAGGLFLLAKATLEIHETLAGKERPGPAGLYPGGRMLSVVLQIMLLDIVFSIDSILTAVGLSQVLWVMITAIVISIGIMLWSSEALSRFIERNPTVKMLALAFLMLIGMALVADGFDFHIPRAYLYFAVTFSLVVEALNITYRKKRGRKET